MGTLINYPSGNNTVNLTSLTNSMNERLQSLIIHTPNNNAVMLVDAVKEHDSEPIKNIEDINRISDYFISKGKYRDNMLWILGINFGLRVSDLLRLKVYDIIDDNYCFRQSISILEKKTRNTRKVKKNRYVTINQAVMDAVLLYLEHTPSKLDDYLFKSESRNGSNVNRPMHRNSVENILKEAKKALGLKERVATHTMRKTFGYHQMVMGGNDERRLLLLQKMFGHSTAMQTLTYIGITKEEVQEAYLNLNLGSRQCYQRFSQVGETA